MLKDNDGLKIFKSLKKRNSTDNKYSFGHVLVIGGNSSMPGSVRLCAEAALRMGAGLVSVATKRENIPIVLNGRPELMASSVDDPNDLIELLTKVNVIVIGPGLGRDNWAKELLSIALESKLPKVVDADALSLLRELRLVCSNSVITPHSAEAARILNSTSEEVESHRVKAIMALRNVSDVIILKGHHSLISDQNEIFVNKTGNAALATAGTGDILSGLVAGLIAQTNNMFDSAKLAVWLHGVAAQEYVAQGNEERSMLASDIFEYIRRVR